MKTTIGRMMVLCVGLLFILSGMASAADGAWTGSGTDNLWTTSGNWGTVPGVGNIATVDVTNNNPLVNMDVATQYDHVYIGDTSTDEVTLTVQSGGLLQTDSGGNITFGRLSGSKGRLEMTAGNPASRQVRVGERGTGTANVSGGTITLSDWLGVGVVAGSSGTFNMSGGTLTAINIAAGNDGTGTIDLSGGSMDASNWVGIGREPGETGTFIVRGTGYLETGNLSVGLNSGVGSLTVTNSGHVKLVAAGSRLRIGEGGTGTVNMNGGTLEVESYVAVGYSTDSSMDMTAGDISVNAFVVGLNGNGTFDMSGGNLVLNSHVRVGESGGEGVWNMFGGTVAATNYISAGWGTTGAGEENIINMSGGLLEMGDLEVGRFGDGTVNLSGGVINVNVFGSGAYTNGLVFDTNGGDGLLDITGDGTVNWLGGNFTNEVNAFVTSGDITASGAGQFVSAIYDTGSNTTVVTAIPEPATLGMIALLGGVMFWIRRTFMI